MNTQRSEKKAKEFLNQGGLKAKRKTQRLIKEFNASPEEVFYQFCPSRELDWIDGWECDLVYTSTGYAEKDCIFTTPDTSILGPGLWIFTEYVPNEKLGLIRTIGDAVVIHFRVSLETIDKKTCTGIWELAYTGLNEQGNAIIDSISEQNPELAFCIDSLEYYLNNGERMNK